MKHYLETTQTVLNEVASSGAGLSSEQAAKRLRENGKNKLDEAKKVSLLSRFLKQLSDPMIIILIAAAVISGVTSVIGGESFADVIIIMFVVIINAILGVYQENKAEKAIEALQEMSAATSKVLRDGKMTTVHSEDLVVGDIILLEAGDAVPADARITEYASLKIEEAALTGESVPSDKSSDALSASAGRDDVPLGDRSNMVYMGSTVVYGRGRAVVVATGMDTEMGKIATAIAMVQEGQTPLQKKLSQLSRVLTYLVIGICVFIFIVGIIRSGSLSGAVVLNTFMIAVSLAVAAIPEGLAAVVTIVLSIGVTNMSKRNAIIRRLTAVETLGCAEIICSDKTGTLTQNKMTVVETYGPDVKLLARAMALCCDAELGANGQAEGEPTECALVNFANKQGLPKDELGEKFPRVGEAPFDSMRKMMSTVHSVKGEKDFFVQYTKGAPDEILKVCDSYITPDGVKPLTDEVRKEILAANKAMADKALRVLAAARMNRDALPERFTPKQLEHNLAFIGLTGMIDPVREEVTDAVARCREAGIRPIMITGDHRDTAVAIAKQLGIIDSPDEAITGQQLDDISDEDFDGDVSKFSVYARVQPEHKVRIVNAWRKKGYVTAMTGDGVNDAPSIKSADIGIGMGITGTDVTKNVADMVLADDNFATIVGAVEEGRRIYDNIRKAIQFLLSSNMSEVISVFGATMLGFIILKPVHLLWINLITDCFPALALGVEKAEDDVMARAPRSKSDGIFAGGLGSDLLYQGILFSVLTFAAYFIGHFMESGLWEITNSPDGTTMAFLTLSMSEIFHSFNMRSQRGSIFKLKTQNLFLWGAAALSLVLTTVVLYVPFLANAFDFQPISLAEYAVAMGLAVSIIPLVELVKFFQRRSMAAKKKK